MASRTEHFKGFSIVQGDIKVDVDLSRFEKQYQDAQSWLDSQIMEGMVPFMPHQTGTFIDNTKAESASLAGTGLVCAGFRPMGQFLYMGKVMVDELTGSPWARKDAKKVVTERDLTYSNPQATPHWFDTAKERHLQAWVKGVKQRAGGG